jgi:hypothetical protein
MKDKRSDNVIPFVPKTNVTKESDINELDDLFQMTPRAMALILSSQHADFLKLTGKSRELFVWAIYWKYIEIAKNLSKVTDWPEQAIRIVKEMEDNV